METIWGKPARCPLLHGGIVEMVRNSCDHAFKKGEDITWHIGVSHNEEYKSVRFSFVDNGKGIIKTFNNSALKKFITLFTGNADLLETAFHGKIKSRTGLNWRGKGLPTIFEMFTDGIITKLIVITNNVYLDFGSGTKEVLPVAYHGTYYSWEVDQNCTPSYFD